MVFFHLFDAFVDRCFFNIRLFHRLRRCNIPCFPFMNASEICTKTNKKITLFSFAVKQ